MEVLCKMHCYTTRQVRIVRHAKSGAHGMAVEASVEQGTGGIQQAFQHVVSLEKTAITGRCKYILFLSKQETFYTTTCNLA